MNELELRQAIWDWYQLPGNETGGALHIVTDDCNVEDQHLDFCQACLTDKSYWFNDPEYTRPAGSNELAVSILNALRELTIEERRAAIDASNPYTDQRPGVGNPPITGAAL